MECRAPRVLAVSGKQHPVPHDDRLSRLYLEMSFVNHRSNICPMLSHQFVLTNLALDQHLMSKALLIKSIENSWVVVILRTTRLLSFLSAIILLLERWSGNASLQADLSWAWFAACGNASGNEADGFA